MGKAAGLLTWLGRRAGHTVWRRGGNKTRVNRLVTPARRAKDFIPHATLRSSVTLAGQVSPDNKNRLYKQRRLLHQATDLFGRKAIAEGLKISERTLDGWMNGGSEMPDSMLMALAHLLVKLAGKVH